MTNDLRPCQGYSPHDCLTTRPICLGDRTLLLGTTAEADCRGIWPRLARPSVLREGVSKRGHGVESKGLEVLTRRQGRPGARGARRQVGFKAVRSKVHNSLVRLRGGASGEKGNHHRSKEVYFIHSLSHSPPSHLVQQDCTPAMPYPTLASALRFFIIRPTGWHARVLSCL